MLCIWNRKWWRPCLTTCFQILNGNCPQSTKVLLTTACSLTSIQPFLKHVISETKNDETYSIWPQCFSIWQLQSTKTPHVRRVSSYGSLTSIQLFKISHVYETKNDSINQNPLSVEVFYNNKYPCFSSCRWLWWFVFTTNLVYLCITHTS